MVLRGGEAPQDCAGDDKGLAAIAVAEPAGERRGQHVDDEHGGGECAHLLAGGVEFSLDEREFAGEDVAIDVVEEVEGDEEDKRGEGWRDERSRCRGSRQADPFLCWSFPVTASLSWFETRLDWRLLQRHLRQWFPWVFKTYPLLLSGLFRQITCYEQVTEQAPGKFLTALDIAIDSSKRKGYG